MKLLSRLISLSVAGFAGFAAADTVLVFNEVMYHPATNEPAMEWVELHNQMGVDVDISDWSVTGGIDYTFPSNTVVRGGGYVVVALDPAALAAATGLSEAEIHGPFLGRLSNNGETLRVRDNSRRVRDELNYEADGNWPVPPDGAGVSLAKRDPARGSANPRHWTWSAQNGGTPGAENFPSVPSGLTLVEPGSTWSYEDSGTDLGSGWREAGFDDGSWAARENVEERSVTDLYSTGLSNAGSPLADGALDPHYVLTAGEQGNVGGAAVVIQNHPNWLANDSSSKWIGVVNPGASNILPGNYNYRTTFTLSDFILSTVRLRMAVAVDNEITDVLLNGASTGVAFAGFAGFSGEFQVAQGFQDGLNTLEFLTVNLPPNSNPGGMRALLSGSGLAAGGSSPLAAGRSTYYFRHEFMFHDDPASASLRLRTLAADGAVFYLNGQEIYRENMPAGPVGYGTPALSAVGNPALGDAVEVSAASLVSGQNVLAVELHMASGSGSEPLLTVALEATVALSEEGQAPVVLNEVAGATNEVFFVELANVSGETVDVGGLVLTRDGATNQTYTLAPGTTVAAQGFLSLTEGQLGFDVAEGDRLLLLGPSGNGALDGLVIGERLRGRFPDGQGAWFFPALATPGTANEVVLRDEIVINEIMYHHMDLPSTNNPPVEPSAEEWIELYNRGSSVVDLSGWRMDDAVRYEFAPGTTLAPGAYMVVAEDLEAMRARVTGAQVVGNYAGSLSRRSERIVLLDASGNPADEVTYYDREPWPEYADGGGSSLELRDPHADNGRAEAWGASDETGKTDWQTFTYRKVASFPAGTQPTVWNDFVFGLLGNGECLVDDIHVVESPATAPLEIVGNGDFSNGLQGWRVLGTHNRSRVIADPDEPGNQVLHLIATGAQEHMHNHIEATLIGNRAIANGREYEISFRARWLAGNSLLNTRLYFNRSAQSTRLPVATVNGTPGAMNSVAVANLGPTMGGLHHAPTIPQPGESVTVQVRVDDPQGVAEVELWRSVNGGGWSSAAMAAQGETGMYSGEIPGGAAGDIVQFYVQALDTEGASSTYPAAGPDSGALYMVEDGQANLDLAQNVRLILSPANRDLLHAFTNVQSNAKLPGTVVHNESRAYYDAGIRLKGSERGRYNDTRVSFHVTFPADDLYKDVHPVMLIDRSGAGDSASNKQQEILIKHMLQRAGHIPGTQSDMIRVIAPFPRHTESAMIYPRNEDEFVETAYEDGGDGQMYELELIYYPTTANEFGYKYPNPDSVNTAVDIMDLGDDKELYRYNFIIKNGRLEDDYEPMIQTAKAWSQPDALLEDFAPGVMDVDQWARVWALVSLCGVNDTYSFGNNHNLLMFIRPSDGKMLAFPWDMDFSFNRGATAALIGDRNISRILRRTPFTRLFYAHVQDLIETVYNTDYMAYWIDHYDNFAPGQNYGAVSGYINTRANFALNTINSAGGNAEFALDPPASVVTNNLLTLTGTAPVRVKTILVNGVPYPVRWTSLNAWRLVVPLEEGVNELELTGEDVRGGLVEGVGQSVTVTYEGPAVDPSGQLVINEIMYDPASPQGAFLEIHNRSADVSFDVSGWRVNGIGYTFPEGSVITNGQFLVLAQDPPSFLNTYGVAPYGGYDGVLDLDGETLSLQRPMELVSTNQTGMAETNVVYLDYHQVRYEAVAPWPQTVRGMGPSLQLTDAAEDAARVSNWSDGSGWREYRFTATLGTIISFFGTNLTFFMGSAGEVIMDDILLVEGEILDESQNLIANPGFESGALAPWEALNSHDGTFITTEARSGNYAMHVVATGAGSTFANVRQSLAAADMQSTKTYTLRFYFRSVAQGLLNFNITSSFRSGSTLVDPIDVGPMFSSPGAPNLGAADLPSYDPVWLNELQTGNLGVVLDGQGEADPWLELYNAGSEPVSLDGYYLSDNYDTDLTQWAFPAGATLAAGEYRIVWLDGEPGESGASEWHASFALTGSTGQLALNRLINGVPQITDYLNYSATAGQSYGSTPDGNPLKRVTFLTVTPGEPNVERPADIYINEWMADNGANLVDPADGNYDDWFELYNAGDEPVDLTGYFLTDDLDTKTQFEIPAGYVIEPGGYLLVWADNEAEQNLMSPGALHVNFALSLSGESIGLYSPERVAIDEVTFGPQTENVSEGRFPDGSMLVVAMTQPTPGAANVIASGNTAPVLDQILDQVAVIGQELVLPVTASDAEVPPQTLSFALLPGGPSGASIDPLTGIFRWTPLGSQPVGDQSFTVRVSDNGNPVLSDEATFVVTVQASPSVEVTRSGDQLTLSYPAIPGRTYRVLVAEGLVAPVEWVPLGEDRLATGTSLIIEDQIGDADQRYYQVLRLD